MSPTRSDDGEPTPNTPQAWLALAQLTDSGAPVGGYAHSHGMEGLAQLGFLGDGSALHQTLEALLHHSLATADLAGVVHAHRAAAAGDLATLVTLGTLLSAQKLAREARASSLGLGKRLLANAANLTDSPLLASYRALERAGRCDAHHCLAFGAVAQALGVAEEPAALGFGYTVLAGAVSAGQRLGVLGQNEAQQLLRRLWPHLTSAVATARRIGMADMRSFSPLLEIAMMRHERAYSRLFSS
jgi:urease accessory protein